MKIQVKPDELKESKVFVATPMAYIHAHTSNLV